jgi:hypothetical protein
LDVDARRCIHLTQELLAKSVLYCLDKLWQRKQAKEVFS